MASRPSKSTATAGGRVDAGAAGDSAKPLLGSLATPRGSIKPPPRQITIDPNIGLPSLEPHADEPHGIWYTVRKSIRGTSQNVRIIFLWSNCAILTLSTFPVRVLGDERNGRHYNQSGVIHPNNAARALRVSHVPDYDPLTFGSTSPTMFYLTQALTNVFVTPFKELNKFDDLFAYYKGSMMDGLYWENWYNNDSAVEKDGIIYYANRVLGVPRMRQFRVSNKSCAIPLEFHEIIEECYGDFSSATESKDAFGNGSYTNDSAWIYREANETGMSSHRGKLASYDGGGYVQDLNLTKDVSEALIKDLEKGRWLDQATRAVLVDFTVYNVNLNLFATIRLCTEVPPTGGLVQSSEIRTIKLLKYQTKRDYTVLAFECMFVIFILYYIGEEVIEVSKLKVRYFKSFWNVLDISVLTCAVICVGFSINHYFLVHETLSALLDIHDRYVDFEYLSFYQVMLTNSMAVTVFFAWIKLFKYLSFNKTMMQLSLTLGRAAKDIASFSIMFFIVFFAFAQLGFFLFGTQVFTFICSGSL
ncbi:hypothetical protein RvY_14513 [Ramazzottius varieornatus]|uniref:Uncharacterized protein n=1 Tax=Ramazzottius varieornatus TaxID=947166 RepID=A0A1D1VTB7_RAMVA|nr:hypothetical protein RvY_14513 [Ramazzottius varieornatus]